MYNDSSFAEGYAIGRDSNNGYNNDMFGGDGAWWIIILLIFGWNGFGGFGNNGGAMNGLLTRNDLCQDMNFNNLENAVRGVQNGLCDGFYAINTSLLNGFNGVNTSILTSANATQTGIANLGYQLQQCCCNVERGIDRLACQSATDTANIIQAGANNTQKILDFLCQEKISGLQAENALLTSQLSQNSQTRQIIDALLPVAKPAYLTCSPYASAFGYPYSNCGYGNGCACGTSIQ